MRNKNYPLPLTLFFILLSFSFSEATIRFVSHTGSSTPPYTTWETAADSIQKCIDYSVANDTIIVANGTYYESLIVNKYLWLIGSSMDSTIIDGTGLVGTTVSAQSDFNLEGFIIIGKVRASSNYVVACQDYSINIRACQLSKAGTGIYFGKSSGIIENVIISDCNTGITTFCTQDTCKPKIFNSLIIMGNSIDEAIDIFDGGNPTIIGNIIVSNNSNSGINVSYSAKILKIKNNLVSGFTISNISSSGTTDSAVIINNVSAYLPENNFGWAGIETNQNTHLRNNITAYNNIGITGNVSIDSKYNLFWQNIENTGGGVQIDSSDIVADPMFVNDTIPTYGGTYDYHLQKYSPAIDAGDPNILDVDGSRSDIGVFGGPYGQMYTYQDLAPKPPANFTAVYDSGFVKLKWNKNTEADLFRYRVYRDTVPNFIYDTTKIIAVVADTFYYDNVPEKYLSGNYYYKITAVDSAYHQSPASEEVHIVITGAPEGPPVVVDEYKLLNNYPNPFNPSTKIPYRLKEGGYVKLMIYDIKGELVKVLVNQYQNAGYYEAEFTPNNNEISRGKIDYPFETGYRGDIASGIYLYRIEVIGEGRIPRFSDMKKMMNVK